MTNIYELCDVDLKDFSIQGTFPSLVFFFKCYVSHPVFIIPDFFFFYSFPWVLLQHMDNKVRHYLFFPGFIIIATVLGLSNIWTHGHWTIGESVKYKCICIIVLIDDGVGFDPNAGCLLRSLPADVIFDNSTGFSFTCDLSDNVAAPWPSSSSISSLSLCAPGK